MINVTEVEIDMKKIIEENSMIRLSYYIEHHRNMFGSYFDDIVYKLFTVPIYYFVDSSDAAHKLMMEITQKNTKNGI